MTESLSAFKQICFGSVLSGWIFALLVFLGYFLMIIRKDRCTGEQQKRRGLSLFDWFLLIYIALMIALVGFVAWISPPNNWDSMTYHMSRVMHWIQNQSVAHYPTHILRQLHMTPWSEYAILHFQVLSGSDHLANLVQWFSLVGATLGVSLIAQQLGAEVRGQLFAAAFTVSLPMAILQGSSTQNDLVVSYWLVCFVYFGMLLRASQSFVNLFAVGVSLGLALLTKATAYLYALPFMSLLGVSLLKTNLRKGIQQIALISIIAIGVNTAHYWRNYDLYSNPLGPGQEGESYRYRNDVYSLASLASNVTRNVGLHLGTPYRRLNLLIEKAIKNFHELLNLELNDARTTWAGTEFRILETSRHEDYAGNPLHLALIGITLFLPKLFKRNGRVAYLGCLISAFLLFSLWLRWQPWHSRLHLPLFVLWAPLVGFGLLHLKPRVIAYGALILVLLAGLPYALANETRPLLGNTSILISDRIELYFRSSPKIFAPYLNCSSLIQQIDCEKVGLILGEDDWEYPFWILLDRPGKEMPRIEHVNVTNLSRVKYSTLSHESYRPCVVIFVGRVLPDKLSLYQSQYVLKETFAQVGIYITGSK